MNEGLGELSVGTGQGRRHRWEGAVERRRKEGRSERRRTGDEGKRDRMQKGMKDF